MEMLDQRSVTIAWPSAVGWILSSGRLPLCKKLELRPPVAVERGNTRNVFDTRELNKSTRVEITI